MNEYDKQHLRNIARIERMVESLFQAAATDAANLSTLIGELEEKAFSWNDYPLAYAKINEIVNRLKSEVEVAIVNSVRSEWSLANDKNDALVRRVFGKGADSITPVQQRIYLARNADALEAFIARKTAGLNLSDRVWRYTNAFRSEIEMGLDIGIRSGLPASQMARELKKYLQYPDKLFRRVRDKHGMLKLSKAAAAFHPGQGVYRSSYMNARRLAATETNIAYRTADHERWQQLDFVVGIEVKMSGNHTCLGRDGKMHELTDICDDLAGKYPKDFKFTGWHPLCRCFATPIMKTDKEMAEENRRFMRGEEPLPSSNSVNSVKDVPEAFKSWIENNQERAKGWQNMPYFVKDNARYTHGFVVDTYDLQERKFTRAHKTRDAMLTAVKELSIRYPEIPNTELGAIYHFTRGDVSAFRQLNNQLRKDDVTEFNEAFATLMERGLEKIEPITATTYSTLRLNKTNLREWLKMANDTTSPITTFDGFTPSSLDRSIVEGLAEKHMGIKPNETDIMLIIRGKSGRPIEDISQFGTLNNGLPNQREVLFIRGKQFRVLSYRKLENNTCGYEFEIEEV